MTKQNQKWYRWTLLKSCALWLLILGVIDLLLGTDSSSRFYAIDDVVVRLLGVPAILFSLGLFLRRKWAFVGSIYWLAVSFLEIVLTYNPRTYSTTDFIGTLVVWIVVPVALFTRLRVVFMRSKTELTSPPREHMKTEKIIGLVLITVLMLLAWGGAAKRSGDIRDIAKTGDVAKVKLLLAGNPDLVNARGKEGWTPLHEAAAEGKKDMAELLLANKADVNTRGKDGRTPLHFAAFRNQKDMVELLLTNKADINAKDNGGATPLHWAVFYNNKDIVKLLLANKADVNARSKNGRTPLHWATKLFHKDIAELLQQYGGVE